MARGSPQQRCLHPLAGLDARAVCWKHVCMKAVMFGPLYSYSALAITTRCLRTASTATKSLLSPENQTDPSRICLLRALCLWGIATVATHATTCKGLFHFISVHPLWMSTSRGSQAEFPEGDLGQRPGGYSCDYVLSRGHFASVQRVHL